MTVGERLRKLRQRENIPMYVLAEWMHMSTSTIQKIETGQRDLLPAETEALAAIFRITPEELWTGAKLTKSMSSGERLRVLRKRAGLSLRELAEKTQIGEDTLGRWERNEAEPKESLLRRAADALDVTPEDIRGGKKWRVW